MRMLLVLLSTKIELHTSTSDDLAVIISSSGSHEQKIGQTRPNTPGHLDHLRLVRQATNL